LKVDKEEMQMESLQLEDQQQSPANSAAQQKRIRPRFTLVHLYFFIGTWIFFSLLTGYILARAWDGTGAHPVLIVVYSLTSVTGPMNGAIVRSFQSCCLEFSLYSLPWFLGFFILFTIPQLFQWPFKKGFWIRYLLWEVGLIGWFLGGPFSFLHALS
jgi:hypothetical protein